MGRVGARFLSAFQDFVNRAKLNPENLLGMEIQDTLILVGDLDEMVPKDILLQFKHCTPREDNVGFYTTMYRHDAEHIQPLGAGIYWDKGPRLLRMGPDVVVGELDLRGGYATKFTLAAGAHIQFTNPFDSMLKILGVAEGGKFDESIGVRSESDLLDPVGVHRRMKCKDFGPD